MNKITEGETQVVESYSCDGCDFYWLSDGGIDFIESADLYREWLSEIRARKPQDS
jgi:hypothetical protein